MSKSFPFILMYICHGSLWGGGKALNVNLERFHLLKRRNPSALHAWKRSRALQKKKHCEFDRLLSFIISIIYETLIKEHYAEKKTTLDFTIVTNTSRV